MHKRSAAQADHAGRCAGGPRKIEISVNVERGGRRGGPDSDLGAGLKQGRAGNLDGGALACPQRHETGGLAGRCGLDVQ